MNTISASVSGTVGKQLFASTRPVTLKGFLLTPLSASARMTIRDGNASGEVKYVFNATAASGSYRDSQSLVLPESGHRFDKGMHVKVIGTGAVGYLFIE